MQPLSEYNYKRMKPGYTPCFVTSACMRNQVNNITCGSAHMRNQEQYGLVHETTDVLAHVLIDTITII